VGTTSSTNDDAKRAAEAGEAEGLVIHALQQTAGRGRHGRTWQSPEGNLYCSVLLRPKAPVQDFGQYSFVASLALGDTVKAFIPQAAITLKWPNDVLIDGKKISGILLESDPGWLVIGMGLNVLHHPDDAHYPSTSLQACGVWTPDIDAVLDTLLTRLWYWYGVMQANGFASIRMMWLKNAQKGRVSIRQPGGDLEGIFETIDEQGHLVLRLADGTERAIATGDVFFALQE
jgi:BirA family biotin operon repressor/biotin-[acetyl-CoA-carboxylase] ligase